VDFQIGFQTSRWKNLKVKLKIWKGSGDLDKHPRYAWDPSLRKGELEPDQKIQEESGVAAESRTLWGAPTHSHSFASHSMVPPRLFALAEEPCCLLYLPAPYFFSSPRPSLLCLDSHFGQHSPSDLNLSLWPAPDTPRQDEQALGQPSQHLGMQTGWTSRLPINAEDKPRT
jgi:hypothetical protein